MNPFLNPIFLTKLFKSHFIDVNRLWHVNLEQLRKYQDKAIRNMVKYAYNVPVYNKKYKDASVRPDDIKARKFIDNRNLYD